MGTAFVGREAELQAIAQLLDGVTGGRGDLAILVGEAGIGKSRLADAVTEAAEGRGFRVAWGRAWESGGAPAYFPWAQALGALGLRAPDASLATAVESEVARFQLFRAVTDELRAASTPAPRAPLLIVLDDLHVADLSSLRMLQFVARELRGMRVLVLVTRRDTDPAMTPETESTLAKIAREGHTFVLARLGRDEVARFVREEGPRIPGSWEDQIWNATEGNPLFVGEMVRVLAADPARKSVPVPEGAREILRQRLSPLDAGAREVLEVAAVSGVETRRAVLVAASGKSEAIVADAIRAATSAGLLAPTNDDRVRFGHVLYRDALAHDVPRARKGAIHGAVAGALEELTPPPLTEIAHHAIEAGSDADVVSRTTRAVVAMGKAYGDEDAIALLERAIAVLPSPDLHVLLGRTRLRIGDAAGGRASCARAAEAARARGDGALLARAALAHAGETTQGETDAVTHALLEEARAKLPDGEIGLRVRLEARIAASLQPAPNPAEVARRALAAVTEARALGDDAVLLDVLHYAGAAFAEAYFVPEVVDMARDAVRLAERVGDRTKLLRARLRLVFALMEIGDIVGADANIDAFDAEARATGQPRHTWPAPLLRSMRATQEGRWDDAEALTEEAESLGGSLPVARATILFHRLARLRAQGRASELLALEPQLLAMIARWNEAETYTNMMIASIRAAAGDLETARAHLARVPLDSTPGRVRIAFAVLAATALRVGDTSRAQTFYDRLLPEADRWHVFGFGGFAAEGTYARYLGGFARLLGRHEDAERHFEKALAIAEAASAEPEKQRILEALARTPATRAPSVRPPAASALTLVAEGDTWLLTLGASSVRLKNGRGVAYIARLMEEPGRDVHVLDLSGAVDGTDAGDAGEALDATARAAYKKRLAELDEELREAETWNDGARATRARGEMEVLSAELARAVGMGGRGRRVGSAAERARVAVTRRIRDVIHRVTEQSPELGRHLDATVKTGMSCSYRPL